MKKTQIIKVPKWKVKVKESNGEYSYIYTRKIRGESIFIFIGGSWTGDDRISVEVRGMSTFGLEGGYFKTIAQANAYTKKAMLHINSGVEKFSGRHTSYGF